MNNVKKILYLGWLGQGNVGDDVLFELFKRMFYQYIDRRKSHSEYDIDGFVFKQGYKYDLTPYDLIVLGGGSLLHLPFWLNICAQAKKCGKPVVSWGTGIDGYYSDRFAEEPVYERIGLSNEQQEFLRDTVSNFELLTVRGPITRLILQNLGIPAEKIIEIGDPALFYHNRNNILGLNHKKILVNWGTSHNNIFGHNEQNVEEHLETAIQILLNRGYEITLYPIWTEDIKHVKRLGSKFAEGSIKVINEVYDANSLMKLINQSYVTINLKLHSNILSAAMDIPFISLAYRGKCFDFTETVNCSELAIRTDQLHAGEILKRLEFIEQDYQRILNKLRIAKKKYRPLIQESFKSIYNILNEPSDEDVNNFKISTCNRTVAKSNMMSKKLFVLGSGRSGTHWIGYILDDHPDIHVSIEKPVIFSKVTSIALNPKMKTKMLPYLLELYQFEHQKVSPGIYADKSHPNLWIAEDLACAFEDAVFVGIQRNPYGTIASMLKHKGVLQWHKRWREFPIPNDFLGITVENAENYESLPLVKKCAMRWLSHKRCLENLQKTLGNRIHILSYEQLIMETDNELTRLQEFLQLSTPFPKPKIKRESLNRWYQELTKQQCKDIEEVVGYGPEKYLFSGI